MEMDIIVMHIGKTIGVMVNVVQVVIGYGGVGEISSAVRVIHLKIVHDLVVVVVIILFSFYNLEKYWVQSSPRKTRHRPNGFKKCDPDQWWRSKIGIRCSQ